MFNNREAKSRRGNRSSMHGEKPPTPRTFFFLVLNTTECNTKFNTMIYNTHPSMIFFS